MIHSLWLLVTAASLLAAGSVSLHAQSLRISWVGQSCFYIQTSDGSAAVVTDPPAPSVGYALPDTSANVLTISHNHTDHNFSQGVRAA
jgi:L-ascorbate metabolism protein UlaG (beta-lactamase superfamily)